jgi:hypothetical protein
MAFSFAPRSHWEIISPFVLAADGKRQGQSRQIVLSTAAWDAGTAVRTAWAMFSDAHDVRILHGQSQDVPMTGTPDPNARPPFWRHRYYYAALKIIILVCAVYLTLRLAGYL